LKTAQDLLKISVISAKDLNLLTIAILKVNTPASYRIT